MIETFALPALSTFGLIALAELGDKSQLLCITLASRHRPRQVLLGVVLAFIALNTAAVLLGSAVAAWIPTRAMAAIAAILFLGFALHAFLASATDDSQAAPSDTGRAAWLATFSLMLIAETGDKTQLAVATLASNLNPMIVWIAATSALITVSAASIWLGHRYLQRVSTRWLNRGVGCVFLVFAIGAAARALAVG